MKKHCLTCFLVLTLYSDVFGQTSTPDDYIVLVNKANSFYKAKDYKNSGLAYSAAFVALGGKGYVNDRYNAACSWALAGVPDSAFLNLERIATKTNYADYKRLTTDPDLKSLYNDHRWEALAKLVAENKEKSEANLNKPLLYLIDSLVAEDQKWRNYLTRFNNHDLEVGDTISKSTIINKSIISDSLNYVLVRDVFKKYGFPSDDLVGRPGSSNFWLLVQHQDNHPGFQDSVLEKMKIAVDVKKASASNYAYLVDRVKVNTGKPQIYGTQMKLNADSTSYEPKPLFEPGKVNARRDSMGLGTIEDYTEAMNNRYRGTLKKR